MKKSFLFLLFALFALVQVNAQDEGAKLAKKAAKNLVKYNIDQVGNKGDLQEAKQAIDEAMKLADVQASASAWKTQGEVYATLAQQAVSMRVINPSAPLPTENQPLIAYKAFKKAFTLSEKKYDKKDALTGVKEVENNMNIFGYDAYERKDYASSYEAFSATLESAEFLKANGEKSMYGEKKSGQTQIFLAGLTALLAGNTDAAMPLYEKLYNEADTVDSNVYEGLYQMKLAKGQEKEALEVLAKGRQKYPEDAGLLFAQINAYLKQGKLDELIGGLNEAISKEPDNVDLYVTLGNVYDNLYTNTPVKAMQQKLQSMRLWLRKLMKMLLQKIRKTPTLFTQLVQFHSIRRL